MKRISPTTVFQKTRDIPRPCSRIIGSFRLPNNLTCSVSTLQEPPIKYMAVSNLPRIPFFLMFGQLSIPVFSLAVPYYIEQPYNDPITYVCCLPVLIEREISSPRPLHYHLLDSGVSVFYTLPLGSRHHWNILTFNRRRRTSFWDAAADSLVFRGV